MNIAEFRQARWNEKMLHELSEPGERAIRVPGFRHELDEIELKRLTGSLFREQTAQLPELSQARVLKHFMRLSQETFGTDNSTTATFGTATMKYSPKVQQHFTASSSNVLDIHPLQSDETIQGLLQTVYELQEFFSEISGLDAVSVVQNAGVVSTFVAACIIRAYHENRGETHRDEIITSVLSHPADAAAPATAGFKIVYVMPDADGLPDVEGFKAAISDRTAGMVITNPEDSGIFNPRIREFTSRIREIGGLSLYDQANANATLGIMRAREAGFDMSYFNLHKTFSAPKGGFGPGASALAVRKELEEFLPGPRIRATDSGFRVERSLPSSIGSIRSYFGNVTALIRAYMWIRQLGGAGLRAVSEIAVLNSNYLQNGLSKIPGIKVFYDEGRRMEQVRYSWQPLKEETGIGTELIMKRMIDYGLPEYYTSHHPQLIPEPFTIEPTESLSKSELDEIIEIFGKIAEEARNTPEVFNGAPWNSATPQASRAIVASAGVSNSEVTSTYRRLRNVTGAV